MNTAPVSQAQLLLQYLFALEVLDAEIARATPATKESSPIVTPRATADNRPQPEPRELA